MALERRGIVRIAVSYALGQADIEARDDEADVEAELVALVPDRRSRTCERRTYRQGCARPASDRADDMNKSEVISRRSALSLLGLAALGLALPTTVLTVSDAEAQQPAAPTAPAAAPMTGIERRQARRTRRVKRRVYRRKARRKGREERRELRRTGTEEKK